MNLADRIVQEICDIIDKQQQEGLKAQAEVIEKMTTAKNASEVCKLQVKLEYHVGANDLASKILEALRKY